MRIPRIGISGLLVVTTTACSLQTVPRSRLAEEDPPGHARLTLMDGTRLGLGGPLFGDDGFVHGKVHDCEGPSCGLAYDHGGVPFDKIDTVQIRKVHGGAVAAFVVVGTLMLVTAVAAASAGQSASDSSSSSSGGGSSSGSSNDWGGPSGSCPRVYSWDGQGFRLDSGTFGGSMIAATQQTDHDVLERIVPTNGQYKLRLKNELQETEYTDAIALRVVDHAAGLRVVPTPDGKLLTFGGGALAPIRATDLRGRDVLADVAARDGVEFRSNVSGRRPDVAADLRDGLVLSFPRPASVKTAKVWLTARNSPWSSTMLDYFFRHLGPAYPKFMDSLEVDAAARKSFDDFLARDGMLHVRAGGTDQLVPLIGPEILKDVALEVPVAGDGKTFELRLDATTGFWNIDSVAVSYEADEPLFVRDVAPRTAITHDGRDVLAALGKIDGERFVTETGDYAELTFDVPPTTKGARTVLLVSTGYYRPNAPPASDADPAAMLKVMATPGAAAARSLVLLEAATARLLLR